MHLKVVVWIELIGSLVTMVPSPCRPHQLNVNSFSKVKREIKDMDVMIGVLQQRFDEG